MMDLSIRLLDQVFMELVYLMILLMTCDALAEIGSLKYLNMYLFFASILGIMGKEYSFSDGRPGTALARARLGTTRQPAVPCLIVPLCRVGSPGTTLSGQKRVVPCRLARWHYSARASPGTKAESQYQIQSANTNFK